MAERLRAARNAVAPLQSILPPQWRVDPQASWWPRSWGRASAFRQLVGIYQQTQQGQPQAVLLVGEAGIGKTRLASEFVVWTWTQGAEVFRGHTFELGGRLPYQPLVEALRERLEAENAPEDLLEDLWLAELSRLLPELRLRYPDLPAPPRMRLSGKLRLFEAVARFLDALAERAPVVLFLDDLHWVDGASLDLSALPGPRLEGPGQPYPVTGHRCAVKGWNEPRACRSSSSTWDVTCHSPNFPCSRSLRPRPLSCLRHLQGRTTTAWPSPPLQATGIHLNCGQRWLPWATFCLNRPGAAVVPA